MNLIRTIALFYFQKKYQIYALFSLNWAAQKAYIRFISPFAKSKKSLVVPLFQNTERLTRSFKNLKINGYKWNGTNGKTALLVHGFEGDSGSLSSYVEPLLAHNYTVLAFDAPAHGLSEGTQCEIYDYADLIQNVLEEYPNTDVVIAHSFGCACSAFAFERLGKLDLPIKFVMIAAAVEAGSALKRFWKALEITPDLQKKMTEIVSAREGHSIEWYSIRRILNETKLPLSTLLIHDRDDEITPYIDAEKLANDNLPNVTFIATNGLGHNQIYKEESVQKMVFDFIFEV